MSNLSKMKTLPILRYEKDGWVFGDIDDKSAHITCSVVGETASGAKMWRSENGRMYMCEKYSGNQYFLEL